jgi:hypothetical protein
MLAILFNVQITIFGKRAPLQYVFNRVLGIKWHNIYPDQDQEFVISLIIFVIFKWELSLDTISMH